MAAVLDLPRADARPVLTAAGWTNGCIQNQLKTSSPAFSQTVQSWTAWAPRSLASMANAPRGGGSEPLRFEQLPAQSSIPVVGGRPGPSGEGRQTWSGTATA